jgi:hypothetical protein
MVCGKMEITIMTGLLAKGDMNINACHEQVMSYKDTSCCFTNM